MFQAGNLDPEFVKKVFYLAQLGIGGLVVAYFLFMRDREPPSGFRVREADLRKPGARIKPGQKDPLADARIRQRAPALLPGIRLDAPAHEILGVKPQASPEEIQKAYRELMKQYHPDRVGRPGSREWQDAQKIAEALNRAKEELLKRRG